MNIYKHRSIKIMSSTFEITLPNLWNLWVFIIYTSGKWYGWNAVGSLVVAEQGDQNQYVTSTVDPGGIYSIVSNSSSWEYGASLTNYSAKIVDDTLSYDIIKPYSSQMLPLELSSSFGEFHTLKPVNSNLNLYTPGPTQSFSSLYRENVAGKLNSFESADTIASLSYFMPTIHTSGILDSIERVSFIPEHFHSSSFNWFRSTAVESSPLGLHSIQYEHFHSLDGTKTDVMPVDFIIPSSVFIMDETPDRTSSPKFQTPPLTKIGHVQSVVNNKFTGKPFDLIHPTQAITKSAVASAKLSSETVSNSDLNNIFLKDMIGQSVNYPPNINSNESLISLGPDPSVSLDVSISSNLYFKSEIHYETPTWTSATPNVHSEKFHHPIVSAATNILSEINMTASHGINRASSRLQSTIRSINFLEKESTFKYVVNGSNDLNTLSSVIENQDLTSSVPVMTPLSPYSNPLSTSDVFLETSTPSLMLNPHQSSLSSQRINTTKESFEPNKVSKSFSLTDSNESHYSSAITQQPYPFEAGTTTSSVQISYLSSIAFVSTSSRPTGIHNLSTNSSLEPAELDFEHTTAFSNIVNSTNITPESRTTKKYAEENATTAEAVNTTTYQFFEELDTTMKSFTQPSYVDLNTSSAFNHFWVKTEIQVSPGEDVNSIKFQRHIEESMADFYNKAIIKEDGFISGSQTSLRRRKRSVTVGNATIQMTNISQPDPGYPWNTILVYYLVEGGGPNITAAARTVYLANLFSIQQMSKMINYIVITQAETYVPPPPPPPSRVWIVGAVIGAILGIIVLGWIILFIYFKCTRPTPQSVSPRSPRMIEGDIDSEFKEIKGFDYVRTEVGMKEATRRNSYSKYLNYYGNLQENTKGGITLKAPHFDKEPITEKNPISLTNGMLKVKDTENTSALDNISGEKIPLAKRKQKKKKKKKHLQDEQLSPNCEDLANSIQGHADVSGLSKGVRNSVHPLIIPSLSQQSVASSAEIHNRLTENDFESLKQKTDIERVRNKQRARKKKKHANKTHKIRGSGDDGDDSTSYSLTQKDIDAVLECDYQSAEKVAPVSVSNARSRKYDNSCNEIGTSENISFSKAPQPLFKLNQSKTEFTLLETDSDEDCPEGSHKSPVFQMQCKKSNMNHNDSLNNSGERFSANLSSGPSFVSIIAPSHNTLPLKSEDDPIPIEPQHTPMRITPGKKSASNIKWSPYTAGDDAYKLIESGLHSADIVSNCDYKIDESPNYNMDVPIPEQSDPEQNTRYISDGIGTDAFPIRLGVQLLPKTEITRQQAQTPFTGLNCINPQDIKKKLVPDNYTSMTFDSTTIMPMQIDKSTDIVTDIVQPTQSAGPDYPNFSNDPLYLPNSTISNQEHTLGNETHYSKRCISKLIYNAKQSDSRDDEMDVVIDIVNGSTDRGLCNTVRKELKKMSLSDD